MLRINLLRNREFTAKCSGPLCQPYFKSCFSSKANTFEHVFSTENKARCQKYLNFDDNFKIMRWMKGRENIRKAAVLVPLCTVNGAPSLLYTVRSRRLTSHRGQVRFRNEIRYSFPGGNHDDTDSHMIETALRETDEEIGLPVNCADIWGQMTPLPGKNFDIAVTPILAYCGEVDISALHLNKEEVETVFCVELDRLCNPQLHGYTSFKKGGFQMPVFTGAPHRIWGLTAIITHLTLRLLVNDDKIYDLHIESTKRIQ